MTDQTNPSQVLEATESFVCEIDGERFVVHAHLTRIAASHKLAKYHPTHFRPVEEGLSYADDATTTDDPGRQEGRARTTRVKAATVER